MTRAYRWRLVSSNGQTVASSGESFASQSNATRASEAFKVGAAGHTFEVYADSGSNYRWRAKASNGQTVASSGEPFSSQSNAQRAADNVHTNAGSATSAS
jgi:uncharacterized protein YegP (UPF0339 family)